MADCLAEGMVLTTIGLAAVEVSVKRVVRGGWLAGCDLGSIESWLDC